MYFQERRRKICYEQHSRSTDKSKTCAYQERILDLYNSQHMRRFVACKYSFVFLYVICTNLLSFIRPQLLSLLEMGRRREDFRVHFGARGHRNAGRLWPAAQQLYRLLPPLPLLQSLRPQLGMATLRTLHHIRRVICLLVRQPATLDSQDPVILDRVMAPLHICRMAILLVDRRATHHLRHIHPTMGPRGTMQMGTTETGGEMTEARQMISMERWTKNQKDLGLGITPILDEVFVLRYDKLSLV